MRYTKPGETRERPFSWSYSKLKNWRTCPKRYYLIDVAKKYQEDFSGEHLKWGKDVHAAFDKRIGRGKKFPKGMENFEPMAQRLLDVPGDKKTEQQLAIREDLSPCEWFAKDAWFRAIADYLCVNGTVALAIDYKTGKIIEDSEQLALMAECVFAHYPQVQAVRTEFWWLKDEAATREDFRKINRKETWRKVLPEVMTLKAAHKTLDFPPRPSGLCRKHCIVKECPHHGVGG